MRTFLPDLDVSATRVMRYVSQVDVMIRSYKDPAVRSLVEEDLCEPEWRQFRSVALRKLDMLNAARELKDLRSPPGNRLERLRGGREGQVSIRINDQWRICFRWTPEGPEEVEICDYH